MTTLAEPSRAHRAPRAASARARPTDTPSPTRERRVGPAQIARKTADPLEIAANPFFRIKLALLLVAGLNMLAFQLARRLGHAHRASAALSIATWLGVLVCGRSIAYW